jgi:DMSO/TMAO reductase YedYZ molybdopterin-dependent catalytic subunit
VKKKIFSPLLLVITITLGFITLRAATPVKGTSEWNLAIDGAVSHPTVLTLNELMAMPNRTVYAELYCFGVYATGGNWTGVSLSSIGETVGLHQSAMSISIYATDGYEKELSITDVLREDVIIAYEMNGIPISETLRLVIPGANGEFWVAMINHITFSTTSVSPVQSTTSAGLNLQPSEQQSAMPQPTSTPTPEPTFTSTPPQPTSLPSATPSPSLPPTDSNPEPFPLTWAVITVAALVVGSTGTTVYLKKRNQ